MVNIPNAFIHTILEFLMLGAPTEQRSITELVTFRSIEGVLIVVRLLAIFYFLR
jgi:hypothetical protein